MLSCKNFKLGKLAAKHDPRTFKFKSYFAHLPPTPPTADWGNKVPDWLMLANDQYGDCTCASAAHMIMLWLSYNAIPIIPTNDQVLAVYSDITGFNPADPNTDQGAVELDVMNYWRQKGILGHKINAFVQVEHSNLDHIRAAINLFGGVYAGTLLPENAMDAFDNSLPWSDTSTSASDGHAIPLVAYDANTITCITWGKCQVLTNEWALKYLDEAYAVLAPDWIAANGLAPSGFNTEQLTEDLKLVS